ncbi:MAG: S8 family peptidase [Cyclobacteriaceae bacterium]
MNRILIGLILMLTMMETFSQTDRYVVFFTDKIGPEYPFRLSKPSDFLSEKAINRRVKDNIAIDSLDLPVHPLYADSLKSLGIDLYFTSKWMNAAIIQTEDSMIASIAPLDFVDSIALIAKGEKLSRKTVDFELPVEFEDPPSVSATTDLQLAILQADVMHRKGIYGEGLLIAVLDNGFRGVDKFKPFEHLWSNNQIIASKDFVENSGNVFRLGDHGTSVFSTIGAKYGDEFSGTAYGASFVLCITEENGSEDRVEEYNWLLGAEFADSVGVDIINSSLGYRSFDIKEHNYDYDDLDGETTIISRAAKIASEKGMLVVISAGNHGDNPPNKWRYITPPADVAQVLTVGSVNPDLTWTAFSSLGPASNGTIKPDVAALGLGATIVRGNGSITRGNGTSYSAPQMAGYAAGVWQTNPEWSSMEVIEAIRSAGHNSHDPDTLIGSGVPFYTYIKTGKAIQLSDVLDELVYFYPNPFTGDKLVFQTEEGLKGKLELEITDGEGNILQEGSIRLSKSETHYEFAMKSVQEGLYFLSLQYDNQKKVIKLINFQ